MRRALWAEKLTTTLYFTLCDNKNSIMKFKASVESWMSNWLSYLAGRDVPVLSEGRQEHQALAGSAPEEHRGDVQPGRGTDCWTDSACTQAWPGQTVPASRSLDRPGACHSLLDISDEREFYNVMRFIRYQPTPNQCSQCKQFIETNPDSQTLSGRIEIKSISIFSHLRYMLWI